MTRFNIILITLLFTLASSSARTLSGRVLAESDSTAVTGATCRIFQNQDLISGASTDENGAFTLDISNTGTLRLDISFTGYSPAEIIIKPGSANLNLGTVFLSESATLGEVTVNAGATVHSRGKVIIYPSAADLKASSTSISLFQKMPFAGMQANPITRSLSVDGGTPMILINGIPSTMTDLIALPPKDIEKIEYSRITPARYADSGVSGFISVKLKQRNDGGQIYLWGRSAVNTAFVDANLRASYHQGKSQFTLLYTPSWRNYQSVYDFTSESYVGNDFRVDLSSNDRNPFNYHYHNTSLKYDLTPDDKTLFSATFRVNPMYSHHRLLAHTFDSQLGEYDNTNNNTSKDLTPSLDLFFRRDFNNRSTLEAQLVGTLSSNDYRYDNDYTYPDGQQTNYIMNVDSRRRSLISAINYRHTFNESTSFVAGYQNTLSRSTNTYLSSDYHPVLSENNNYVYARINRQFGKVFIGVASGAKIFSMKNDLNRRTFVRNLSQAQVSWTVNNHWSIDGSFYYTPSIPSLSNLTNYPQQTTPYLINNGNPELKVAENLRYMLDASYTVGKFSATLTAAYLDIRNPMVSEVSYLGDRLFLTRTENARSAKTFQGDMHLKISGISGFGASLYVSLCHYLTKGEQWRHTLTAVDGSLSLWWSKGPVTLSYWRKLPGKYLNGQTIGKDENGDALSVEYSPNQHWSFAADWMYMFDRKGTRYPRWDVSATNPGYVNRFIRDNGNMLVLSVVYKADFGSIFSTPRRSLNNSDTGSSLLKL